jgi:hypothetical protein
MSFLLALALPLFYGISAQAGDLENVVKLPVPGITFHLNEASASRVPWINSNGWRFLRQPNARFSYDVKGNTAALAAAEAFSFHANATVETDSSGQAPLADMQSFIRTLPSHPQQPVADIGFIDDGSAASAEVMNLLVRNNLMFKIVRSPDPALKLNVHLDKTQNPDLQEHKIRADLTDARRVIRIYGTSIVVARVVGEPGRLRIHLLNYGAGQGARIGAFRVRVLGRYSKAQLHSFGSPNAQVTDFNSEQNATEFTVPELKTYAVVDLSK